MSDFRLEHVNVPSQNPHDLAKGTPKLSDYLRINMSREAMVS